MANSEAEVVGQVRPGKGLWKYEEVCPAHDKAACVLPPMVELPRKVSGESLQGRAPVSLLHQHQALSDRWHLCLLSHALLHGPQAPV